ncbi:hypothetical protein Tcan_02150 [Toxocara canis]|uniref:G_PROTEIN_RECEP_F1_2 domain-containing protein n=1 Tax=Toxocara canis TaxID=6265 RepID=A0A0B2UKQ4_TOXCA|nr:hypothetical protein Tcan_02150 [Toxocara canis]
MRIDCFISSLPNIVFALGMPMLGFSVLLISVDRFCAVISPIRYFKYEKGYAWRLICSFTVLALFCQMYTVLRAVQLKSTNPKDYGCILGYESDRQASSTVRCVRVITVIVAALLYTFTLLLLVSRFYNSF